MKVPYHWKANFYLQKDQYTYMQQALSVNINEMCMSTDAFSIEPIENIWLLFTSKVHKTDRTPSTTAWSYVQTDQGKTCL